MKETNHKQLLMTHSKTHQQDNVSLTKSSSLIFMKLLYYCFSTIEIALIFSQNGKNLSVQKN